MAVAVRPSKSILNIRSGIKSVKETFSGLKRETTSLNKVLLKKTKVKKESISRSYILFQKRNEEIRRKNREDVLEASTVRGAIKAQGKAIAASSKGFLGRIMDFLGTLLVGWLLTNLPTIIAMAQELIARMQKLSYILGDFFDSTLNLFRGFGRLITDVGNNIISLDFTDSRGRVENSLNDLQGTLDQMQTQFEDGFRLLSTPLDQGIASGENAPPTGTQYPNQTIPPTSAEDFKPGTGSSSGGGGGGQWKPILDVISEAESKQNGYNAIAPGDYNPNLSKMTIAEANKAVGVKGGKGAIGRYQLTNPIGQAAAANLKPSDLFSPENQDKIAIALIKGRGVTLDMIKNDPKEASVRLSAEWAGLPLLKPAGRGGVGQSYYEGYNGNSATISASRLEQAFKQVGSNPTPTTSTTSRPAQTPTGQQSTPQAATLEASKPVIPIENAKFKGGEGSFGAPRKRSWGMDSHAGIDISEASWKPGSDPKVPVVAIRGGVVSSIEYKGGQTYMSGCMIEQDDGYTVRYLHMEPFVRPGQKVVAGQKIGRLYDDGNNTHLHIELYQGSAKSGELINPTSYVETVLKGGVPPSIAGQQRSPAQLEPQIGSVNAQGKIYTGSKYGYQSRDTVISKGLLPLAQISSSQAQQNQQLPQQITPEKRGQDVVVMNQGMPQQSSSGGGIPGGGGGVIPIVINPLNSFIKNKLLLDLAYT